MKTLTINPESGPVNVEITNPRPGVVTIKFGVKHGNAFQLSHMPARDGYALVAALAAASTDAHDADTAACLEALGKADALITGSIAGLTTAKLHEAMDLLKDAEKADPATFQLESGVELMAMIEKVLGRATGKRQF